MHLNLKIKKHIHLIRKMTSWEPVHPTMCFSRVQWTQNGTEQQMSFVTFVKQQVLELETFLCPSCTRAGCASQRGSRSLGQDTKGFTVQNGWPGKYFPPVIPFKCQGRKGGEASALRKARPLSALLQCPQPPWWGMGGQTCLGPIGLHPFS